MAKHFDASELVSFGNFVLEQNGVEKQVTAEQLEAWKNRGVEMVDVTVTQEILDMNPDMAENGVEVGDVIGVTKEPLLPGESGVVETPAKKGKK